MPKQSDLQKEFVKEIDRLQPQVPNFKPDNVFCYWFLKAYVFGNEKPGVELHVCGAAGDGGFDAIAIDDSAEIIHIVQAKYRVRPGKLETAKELLMFIADARKAFAAEVQIRSALYQASNPRTIELLKNAYKKVTGKNYRLQLYYLTTGSVSGRIENTAQQQLRAELREAELEVIDWAGVQRIFRTYSDGIAPPIPTVTLDIDNGLTAIAERTDGRSNRRCWVFPAAASSVARLFEECGVRLFAKNVRGYLGGTSINAAMKKTLRDKPEDFYYFNNGITIICSQADYGKRDRASFRLWDAQIVNGQQTVRTIAEGGRTSSAAVVVKIIEIPRKDSAEYEDFISRTVAATNSQNAIKYSDLRSNDARQIALELELRNHGYLYIRKRQSKREAVRFGGQSLRQIKKEDLAQAVAACLLDPHDTRSGIEKLFANEQTYETLFASHDVNFYITAWWLRLLATRVSKEGASYGQARANRGYAKWLVINFIWSQLSKELRSGSRLKNFAQLVASSSELNEALWKMFRHAYLVAGKYYAAENPGQLDISRFYRDRREHHKKFARFWDSRKNSRRRQFRSAFAEAREALES